MDIVLVFTIESLPPDTDFGEEFEELPAKKRQCTDTFFLIIFITLLTFVSYIIFDVILTKNSNPNLIIHGYDNFGNICGQTNQRLFNLSQSGQNKTDSPYLLIGSDNVTLITRCVKQCPSDGFFSIAFYRCLPHDSRLPLLIDAYNTTRSFFEDVLSDLSVCWKEITYLSSISLVFALIILVLLRYLAWLVIWLTLLALALSAVTGSAYIWFVWNFYKSQLLDTHLDNDQRTIRQHVADQWFVGGVCASVLTFVFVTIITFMRKRIKLVSILFREAGKAIGDMPFILMQPFWTFCILFGLSLCWIYGLIYLQSTRIPFSDPFNYGFVSYKLDPFYRYMKWCHMFAYLWAAHFILCSQHFVVSGSVAIWFFKRNKSELNCPQSRMIWVLIRYHLGSIAMGSLLVASVKLLRILFKRLDSVFDRYKDSCDRTLKLCRCCLWFIEKFIIFVNKNTFIEIAIYGEPYCASAKRAFASVTDNALRVLALNSVGDFLLFVAKICVVVATALISIPLIEDKSKLLNYYWSPVIVSSLFAYFVSHCFLSVYEIAIDTLFLCFIEDCRRNDGLTKPYFMTKRLVQLVDSSRDSSPNRVSAVQ